LLLAIKFNNPAQSMTTESTINDTTQPIHANEVIMAAERERFYECEVKRRRVRAAGGYEAFWKVKPIAVALEDNDTEFRCMNCGGAVKLFKRRSEDGPATHIEHKLKSDSEYCSAGMYFLKATDGRLARLSSTPVR
jgi:hypothetical protein